MKDYLMKSTRSKLMESYKEVQMIKLGVLKNGWGNTPDPDELEALKELASLLAEALKKIDKMTGDKNGTRSTSDVN